MKCSKKTIMHIIICSAIYFIPMMLLVLLNYIDLSMIGTIYLPIFFIAIAAALVRQYFFTYVFTVSVELGLIVEYIIHLSQRNHPTMAGAFVNLFITCFGFILAVVGQIIIVLIRRTNKLK